MRSGGRGSSAHPAVAILIAAAAALSSCSDLGIVSDVVFPTAVPGLRSDQPWVSLPVGAWMIEGGMEAKAISACFSAACESQAAVALLVATGEDAARITRVLDDPSDLALWLRDRAATPVAGRRRLAVKTVISVERRQDGAFSGFALQLARPDGSRAAAGYALASRRPGGVTLLLVVAASEVAARRVARDIVPHLR